MFKLCTKLIQKKLFIDFYLSGNWISLVCASIGFSVYTVIIATLVNLSLKSSVFFKLKIDEWDICIAEVRKGRIAKSKSIYDNQILNFNL